MRTKKVGTSVTSLCVITLWQHGNLYFFCIFFQLKNRENNYGKNISFNLGFIDKFFVLSSVFYYAKSELKFGIKIRPITCMKCSEIFTVRK